MLDFPRSSIIPNIRFWNSWDCKFELYCAKSMEKNVFDMELSTVMKATRPISTTSPPLQHWSTWSSNSFTFFCRRICVASSRCGANIFVAESFLRFLQRANVGNHDIETLGWLNTWIESGIVRLDKAWSFFCSASLAMSGEEMTMVVKLPSLRVIKGP